MLFRMTRKMSCSPCAPSADRIPISRVRCVTANDITPYNPAAASTSAQMPKAMKKLPKIL
jgi:hypothetical protein